MHVHGDRTTAYIDTFKHTHRMCLGEAKKINITSPVVGSLPFLPTLSSQHPIKTEKRVCACVHAYVHVRECMYMHVVRASA